MHDPGRTSRANPVHAVTTALIILIVLFNIAFWASNIKSQIDSWTEGKLHRWDDWMRSTIDLILTDYEKNKSQFTPEMRQQWSQYLAQARLLYGQIVIDGDQIATDKSEDAEAVVLSVEERIGKRMQTHWIWLSNGIPCLVIQRTIARSDDVLYTGRYLEIGISAAELQISGMWKIIIALLFTLLTPILVVLLVARLLSRRWTTTLTSSPFTHNQSDPQPGPESESPSQVSTSKSPPSLAQEPPAEPRFITQKKTIPTKGGPLVLYLDRRLVEVRGQTISLTPKEHKLLSLLASKPGCIFSEKEIIAALWEGDTSDSPPTSKDVKQHIFFLRKKLADDAESPLFIYTERGSGYKLLTENSTKI